MNEINACTKFQLAVPDLLTSRLNLTLGNLSSSNLEVPPEYQVVDVILLLVDSQKILMTIEVRRLSGIYFLTLFIPSLCLITAASLTLFIGKTHFEQHSTFRWHLHRHWLCTHSQDQCQMSCQTQGVSRWSTFG